MRKHDKLLLRCFIAFALLLCFRLSADQPHIQRSGANLVTNPDISGSANWVPGGSAVYDSTVSRDGGTGSFKMTIPYPNTSYSYVDSALISVTPGNTYTLAFYMLSNIFPSPGPIIHVCYYDSNWNYVRTSPASIECVSDSNSWQECVYLFRPQPGEVYVKIDCTLYFQPNGSSGSVWVDNFYLGSGIGFEQPPTAKTAFNGTRTQVDAFGNVKIYKNGAWYPFFPIAVYADGSRADWTVYSVQGFNTNMWAGTYADLQKAKNATSVFNPDGMMSGLGIAGYTSPLFANYNNIALLTSTINQIKAYGLMDSLLWYYWDNENCPGEWAVPLAVINTIRELDTDTDGISLMHPVYCLEGDEGIARRYNNSNVRMTDIIGSYVTADTVTTYPDETRGALKLITTGNVEQQKNPVVIAQINSGAQFSPRVFNAIANGAKGIGFWKDGGSAGAIENQPWWSDLPNIRHEIDQLLPIIQTPHWTSWSLSSNNSLADFGTRDYQGEGYVIATNEQSTAQSVTCTIAGLPYTATAVRNFFTNEIEAYININQFNITVPACGSKVYVLESNIEEMLALKLLCSESGGTTAYDGSYFANNGTLLNGAAFSSGAVSLDGANDRVNCGHNSSLEIGTLDLTITARVKLNATQNTYAGIVTKGAGSPTDAGYTFMYNNGTLNFWLSNGTARINAVSSNVSITDNAWHTVAVSVTRNGSAVFYVDGISAGSSSVSSLAGSNIVNTSRDLLVGSWINAWHLYGLIDNIRIYRKALTSQEMADLSGNIILDMQLNETSGTAAYDSSSYSSNGALYGNAALGSGVLTLDGNGDYADCGHPSALEMGVNNMTIISRVKLDQTQNTYCGIVTKGAASPTDAGYTFMYNNGTLNFWLSNGTARINAVSNNVSITDNAWHTVGVSVTRNGNAVFYVDGISAGSCSVSSLSSSSIVNANRNLLLGSWISYYAYSLRGSMDYVKISKRALTSAEMGTATR